MHETKLWKYIEGLPALSASLYSWKLHLGTWPFFKTFMRRYLQCTGSRVWGIECITDCGDGCWRTVVEHGEDDIVAVCSKGECSAINILSDEIFIYKINVPLLMKDICTLYEIEYSQRLLIDFKQSLYLGEGWNAQGAFKVYFTHQMLSRELLAVVRELTLFNKRHVIIVPSSRLRDEAIDRVLVQTDAVLIEISKLVYFGETGFVKKLDSLDSIVNDNRRTVLEVTGKMSPDNIFRRRGAMWEIRFNQSELFYLPMQKGAHYISKLLSQPFETINVLDLYSDGRVDDQTRMAVSSNGFQIGDRKYINDLKTNLESLNQEIAAAEATGDINSIEHLENKKDKLLTVFASMVDQGNNVRKMNDPMKKPRDAVNKSISRTIALIRTSGLESLAIHLEKSITGAGQLMYRPTEQMKWDTQPVTE